LGDMEESVAKSLVVSLVPNKKAYIKSMDQ